MENKLQFFSKRRETSSVKDCNKNIQQSRKFMATMEAKLKVEHSGNINWGKRPTDHESEWKTTTTDEE